MRKVFVVLALLCMVTASAQRVRVMSYNIKNGNGMDGIKSIERCADIIRNINPDIVAIQEVDSMTRRNNYYVLGKLAEHAGYPHAYFGKTINYRGGTYGIGVLSKEKACSVKFYPMPNKVEDRGLLVVEFKNYYLLCTHLSGVPKNQGRGVQVDTIREVAAKLDKPAFIAGDMNARPESAPMAAFREFATILSDEGKFTAPSNYPSKCIDYILGTNGKFKVLKNSIMFDCLASDHLPIYVDVKVGKVKKSKK